MRWSTVLGFVGYAQHAQALVDQMKGMYTIEVKGENVLVDAKGEQVKWAAIEAQAKVVKQGGGVPP